MNTTTRIQPSDNLSQAFEKVHTDDQDGRLVLNNLLAFAVLSINDEKESNRVQIELLEILDKAEIYGARITQLYKFVCGSDMREMLTVLDDLKTGKITKAELDKKTSAGVITPSITPVN